MSKDNTGALSGNPAALHGQRGPQEQRVPAEEDVHEQAPPEGARGTTLTAIWRRTSTPSRASTASTTTRRIRL